MGRLSLGERLDADLVDVGTDKRNPNGITRCLSMTVNKDQHQENRTKIKVISIMSGDRSFWQWVKQSAREIVISDDGEGRAKRSRSLTSNGLTYKKEMFKERKVSSRFIRKYSIIEELLFSVKNIILVEEEIKQLNELFSMLLDELFFFVVWLTEERRLVLISAGTIVRDSHHRESLTRREQDLNPRRTWVQA